MSTNAEQTEQLRFICGTKSFEGWGGTCLACPARFERATWALEEFVAVRMSMYFNELQR